MLQFEFQIVSPLFTFPNIEENARKMLAIIPFLERFFIEGKSPCPTPMRALPRPWYLFVALGSQFASWDQLIQTPRWPYELQRKGVRTCPTLGHPMGCMVASKLSIGPFQHPKSCFSRPTPLPNPFLPLMVVSEAYRACAHALKPSFGS